MEPEVEIELETNILQAPFRGISVRYDHFKPRNLEQLFNVSGNNGSDPCFLLLLVCRSLYLAVILVRGAASSQWAIFSPDE